MRVSYVGRIADDGTQEIVYTIARPSRTIVNVFRVGLPEVRPETLTGAHATLVGDAKGWQSGRSTENRRGRRMVGAVEESEAWADLIED